MRLLIALIVGSTGVIAAVLVGIAHWRTTPSTPAAAPTATPAARPVSAARPATSPSPGRQAPRRCAAVPHLCGFPDATNTGVPAGMKLREVPGQVSSGPGWYYNPGGWVQVTGNGAVLRGLDITGNLNIEASGVTVTHDRIETYGNTFGISLRHTRDVTIENSDISSPRPGPGRLMVGIKDIFGDSTGLRILRNNITNTATGVQVESGLVEGNYIHDMGYRKGDHVNGVTSNGGNTALLTIRHNTIFVHRAQTDAIGLFEDFGVQADRVIEDNLLAGGGYSIYGGQRPGGAPTASIRITGNLFSRIYYPHGGYYGQVAYFAPQGRGNLWRGNTWSGTSGHMTGAPVAAP